MGGYVLWLAAALGGLVDGALGWIVLWLVGLLAVGGVARGTPTLPIDVRLEGPGRIVGVGEAFGVDLVLEGRDQGVIGAQVNLAWTSELFVIEGVATHVPHYWGHFPPVFGGVNDDLGDGRAVYVYLCPVPPGELPTVPLVLATIEWRAVGEGEGWIEPRLNIPESTLTTRVVNQEGEIVTGRLTGTEVWVREPEPGGWALGMVGMGWMTRRTWLGGRKHGGG